MFPGRPCNEKDTTWKVFLYCTLLTMTRKKKKKPNREMCRNLELGVKVFKQKRCWWVLTHPLFNVVK